MSAFSGVEEVNYYKGGAKFAEAEQFLGLSGILTRKFHTCLQLSKVQDS